MKAMKTALLCVGVLAALTGLVWMGQGSGYFPYPASSFMIDESAWIYRGFVVMAVGVVLAAVSRLI